MSIATLPDVLLSDLFSKWIGLKTLTKFDSSFTNHKHRENFLEILRRDVPFVSHLTISGPYLTWLILRGIKIDRLADNTCCCKDFDFYFNQLNFSQVRFLKFESYFKVDYVRLIQKCPRLTSLSFCSYLQQYVNFSIMFPEIDSKILNELTSLSYIVERDLPTVTQYCSNLVDIKLSSDFSGSTNALPVLIEKNLKMKNILLYYCCKIPPLVFSHYISQFPHINWSLTRPQWCCKLDDVMEITNSTCGITKFEYVLSNRRNCMREQGYFYTTAIIHTEDTSNNTNTTAYTTKLNTTSNNTNIACKTMTFVTVVQIKQNTLSNLILPHTITAFKISNIVNVSVKHMFKLLINNKNIHKLTINGVLVSKKWRHKLCDLLVSHQLCHVEVWINGDLLMASLFSLLIALLCCVVLCV
jgi:hypothetical protein